MVQALQAVDAADVALIIDATVGIAGQDQRLAERVDAAAARRSTDRQSELFEHQRAKVSSRSSSTSTSSATHRAPGQRLTGEGVHRLPAALRRHDQRLPPQLPPEGQPGAAARPGRQQRPRRRHAGPGAVRPAHVHLFTNKESAVRIRISRAFICTRPSTSARPSVRVRSTTRPPAATRGSRPATSEDSEVGYRSTDGPPMQLVLAMAAVAAMAVSAALTAAADHRRHQGQQQQSRPGRPGALPIFRKDTLARAMWAWWRSPPWSSTLRPATTPRSCCSCSWSP